MLPPVHCPSIVCGLDSRLSFWKEVGGGGKITVLTSAPEQHMPGQWDHHPPGLYQQWLRQC